MSKIKIFLTEVWVITRAFWKPNTSNPRLQVNEMFSGLSFEANKCLHDVYEAAVLISQEPGFTALIWNKNPFLCEKNFKSFPSNWFFQLLCMKKRCYGWMTSKRYFCNKIVWKSLKIKVCQLHLSANTRNEVNWWLFKLQIIFITNKIM